MPAINYHRREFSPVSNSANGEVDDSTVFIYTQKGDLLTGSYSGKTISAGHLLGTVNPDGTLDFYYHHRNSAGELMAGKCRSVPEIDIQGKLILKETWQWLTGDQSSGNSILMER